MKRAILLLSIIALAAVGFAMLFGYQALQTIVGKPKLLAVRECTLTPQLLSLTTDKAAKGGTELSQFGYTIIVPWLEPRQRYGSGNAVTNVVFDGGQKVTLLDPVKYPDLLDFMGKFARDQTDPEARMEAEEVHRLFATMGHEEFYNRLLHAHPSEFSIFMGKREAKQLKLCLMMKATELMDYSAIYAFADGERRGFQLGNPQTDTRRSMVILFDGCDTPVRFWVSRVNGKDAIITRQDIVQMIKSFRWVRPKTNAKS